MYAILGVGCSLVAAILFTRWLRKADTQDFDEDGASVSSEEVVTTDADDVSEAQDASPVADSASMDAESFSVAAVAERVEIATFTSAPLQVIVQRYTRSAFVNSDVQIFTAGPVFCAQPEPEVFYKIRATLDSVVVTNFSVFCKADEQPQAISEEFKSPVKGMRSDLPSPRRSHQVSKRANATSEAEDEEEWPEDNVTVTPSKSFTNRFRTPATPTRLIPIACLANFHPVDGILQGIELISPNRAPAPVPESIRTPPDNRRRALGAITNQSPNIRSPQNTEFKSPDATVMSSPSQGAKRVARVSRRTG